MSLTILIWVALSALFPEGPPKSTHSRGSGLMALMQEWDVTSHMGSRMETVQEVPDFTLKSKAKVGHWAPTWDEE